jgi:hypothetical protein
MRIYVFVSRKSNETGDNLPAALSPWYQEVIPGISVIDIENDPISEAVRQHGYFVAIDRISDWAHFDAAGATTT